MGDKKELEDALQTVQRLYMKVWGKKECVEFYAKYIQPIYREFEAENVETLIKCVMCGNEFKGGGNCCDVCWLST